MVKHYWADLRIMIIGMIIIGKAMISEISMSINVLELVISFHANIRDKKINASRVNPMFIIDFNIVSELIAFLFFY